MAGGVVARLRSLTAEVYSLARSGVVLAGHRRKGDGHTFGEKCFG